MDPDDEAVQEMHLEPRSSIPHPMNSVPVTPAAIQAKPLYANEVNNANTAFNQSPRTQPVANVTVAQKVKNNTFIPSNTSKQPDKTLNAAPVTTSSNQLSTNATLQTNYFVPQQANQQPSFVSQRVQSTENQPHLSMVNKEANALQNMNMNVQVSNNEQKIAPESVSFGVPSKPLTPIKSIPETTVSKVEKENDNQENSNTTIKPTTSASLNKSTSAPATIVKVSPAEYSGNKSTHATAKPNENKNLNVVNVGKMETNSTNVDLNASGSGDDSEEGPEDSNDVPRTNEKLIDHQDDDEDNDDDDDSGSGEEESKEDNAKPFLHDNHTLTSTTGVVKIDTKQAQHTEVNPEEDQDMDNAVEDALDKETSKIIQKKNRCQYESTLMR